MKTIFDIGMYDASDTIYYLDEGYGVVAVEANPALVECAENRLRHYVEAGRLRLVNAAFGPNDRDRVDLILSGDDLGSSSIFREKVADRNPTGSVSVRATSVQELFAQFGVPYYIKIDIEGADRFCILALTDARPQFLSFEIGDDVYELVGHLSAIGYERFKIINQCRFLELANQDQFHDRMVRRVIGGNRVKRAGRFFVGGHASGPVPWYSDGKWYSAQAVLSRWRDAKESGKVNGWWYDIHAARGEGGTTLRRRKGLTPLVYPSC